MNKKALLLEEINHMPENIVDEVIDFVQFLKGKKTRENKKNNIVGDGEESWPGDYFSLFGALDEGDLVEPREIPFKHDSNRENL
jgi:hypothetical protein